jgi:hypothetical protein
MMTCKEFVFITSTDQWPESSWNKRLAGKTHQWICPHCRAFLHNDQILKHIIQNYKEDLQKPEKTS